jgi:hypothetical protein
LELFYDIADILVRLLNEIVVDLLELIYGHAEVHANEFELFEVLFVEHAIEALHELDIEIVHFVFEN